VTSIEENYTDNRTKVMKNKNININNNEDDYVEDVEDLEGESISCGV